VTSSGSFFVCLGEREKRRPGMAYMTSRGSELVEVAAEDVEVLR
jgi:hypothetical protein